MGALFEKSKDVGSSELYVTKVSDLIYINFDQDLKVKLVKENKKKVSTDNYNYEFLFMQQIDKEGNVAYFYANYDKDEATKQKNWNLYINLIKKGELTQEKISITSKDNYIILPHKAKEGYILLNEYNKKEKYNQVRLERLN